MTASEGKNLCLIGVPEVAERDRGPESVLKKSLRTFLMWKGKQAFISRRQRDPP